MDFEKLRQIQNETEQVQKLYEMFCEDTRLTHSKAAQVEFITTVKYIEKYLQPKARILDLGAGTGRYSLYFAAKGHDVSAVELSPNNVEIFREKIDPAHPVDLRQGSAIDLSCYPDESFDAVLVFGPLYHLHNEQDRQRCIAEAKRVCKPDGTLFFALISNDMVILTEFSYDQSYFSGSIYDHDTFHVEDFPFVFFTVSQCREMLQKGGVTLLREVAADGMSEMLADKINALDDQSYSQYLKFHFYCCEKPELLGYSNHLLFVCKK